MIYEIYINDLLATLFENLDEYDKIILKHCHTTDYNKVAKNEYIKNGNKISNKERYANGFIQGAEHGFSLNFDTLDKYSKIGQKAGVRARKKSENLKF